MNVGKDPRAVAVGADSLWVANYEDDTVTRDPDRGPRRDPRRSTTIQVGDGPVDVTFGEGAVWVANQLDGTVTRIDAESGEVVVTIPSATSRSGLPRARDTSGSPCVRPRRRRLVSDASDPVVSTCGR